MEEETRIPLEAVQKDPETGKVSLIVDSPEKTIVIGDDTLLEVTDDAVIVTKPKRKTFIVPIQFQEFDLTLFHALRHLPDGHDTVEIILTGVDFAITPVDPDTLEPVGKAVSATDGKLSIRRATTFFALPDGAVGFILAAEPPAPEPLYWMRAEPGETTAKLWKDVKARNEREGITPPVISTPKPADGVMPSMSIEQKADILCTPAYFIHTGQEFDELMSAAADGSTLRHYQPNPQAGTLAHVRPDSSHFTRLSLTEEEIADGMQIANLEQLVKSQDADCIFVLLYVSRLLAPPAPLPGREYAGGWIDLDDVAEKTLGKPRDTKERAANRRRVWEYLKFGARAAVSGKRTGKPYRDPDTGQEIPTEIDAPLWVFVGKERPTQTALLQTWETPLRVEVVFSKDLERLITNPHTCQYLPFGELLGAIAPDKPSGAWARVIGLSLANFWRREPQESLKEPTTLRPTRRELLERYPPKLAPIGEILEGKNPDRAIQYWQQCLGILVEKGFVEPTGEADRARLRKRPDLPRKGWKQEWLAEPVDLRPGPTIRQAVEDRAKALPPAKPRQLGTPKRRPGRPRKKPENPAK